MKSLLPHNASSLEVAIDLATADRLAMDLSAIDVDPKTCDVTLLPFLAKAWQVDIHNMTVKQQRKLLIQALEIHRYKGTLHAVQVAANSMFANSEIIEHTKPFHFNINTYFQADSTAVYDLASFSQTRRLVNTAKNVRSRFGDFILNLPQARIPVTLSTAVGVVPKVTSQLTLDARAVFCFHGAMQWIL